MDHCFTFALRRVVLIASTVLLGANGWAAGPRVLPAGKLPDDARLQPLKDLDGYFPFTPPASKAEWDKLNAQDRLYWTRKGMAPQ